MIKLGQLFRQGFQTYLKEKLKDRKNIFVLDFSTISSPQMSDLRKELKRLGARMIVVKNSIAKRVLTEIDLGTLESMVAGSVALVYSDGDAVDISKTLIKFVKGSEASQIRGGILQKTPLTPEDVRRLSSLPGRPVLLSMLLSVIQSPMSALSYVLSYKIRSLLFTLKQISDKKN